MNPDEFSEGDRVRIVWRNRCDAELEYVGEIAELPSVENSITGEEYDKVVLDADGYGRQKSFTPTMIVEMEMTEQRHLNSF